MSMHSERKRMKCESCDKEFEGEKALKRHIRIAHEGLRVPCKQCDKRFTSNQSRNRHFMVIHETKKIELKCDKTFSKKNGLLSHWNMNDSNVTKILR